MSKLQERYAKFKLSLSLSCRIRILCLMEKIKLLPRPTINVLAGPCRGPWVVCGTPLINSFDNFTKKFDFIFIHFQSLNKNQELEKRVKSKEEDCDLLSRNYQEQRNLWLEEKANINREKEHLRSQLQVANQRVLEAEVMSY